MCGRLESGHMEKRGRFELGHTEKAREAWVGSQRGARQFPLLTPLYSVGDD